MLNFRRVPESPRWLIDQDRTDEGFAVLRRLHSRADDPDKITAKEEFYQIREQIELERAQGMKTNWLTLFKKPSYRKRLVLGFATQFIAQSTGGLVVNNYQILLYKSLGITGSLPLALNATYNGIAAIGNFINSLFLDRLGRIRIMLIGLVRTPTSLRKEYTDRCLDRLQVFSHLFHRDGKLFLVKMYRDGSHCLETSWIAQDIL